MAADTFIIAAGIQAAKAKLFRPETPQEDEAIAKSYLGTPVFAQVEIQGGNYFELDDVDKENPIPYEGIIIQTALLVVSQTKNIITTAIQGRDGTIKEYVSRGDFMISLSGNIVGQSDIDSSMVSDIGNKYPEVDTKKMIEICNVPDPITITSSFLQQFGINDVVIKDYRFSEKRGTRNEQPFQINMLSDSPIDLNELAAS